MRASRSKSIQPHARAVYIIDQCPLPYYDLFMPARSTLSQPCFQHILCMQVAMYYGWKVIPKEVSEASLLVI